MTHILMPFSPERACKILNGKITTDVRKRIPKPPFTAWMYCTKARRRYTIGCMIFNSDELYRIPNGEIKYGSSVELMAYDNYDKSNFLSGKVVAKFVVEKAGKITFQAFNDGAKNWTYRDENGHNDELLKKSCLNLFQMHKILKGNDGHALPITSLEILEKPLPLTAFRKVNPTLEKIGAFGWAFTEQELPATVPITKAPSTWCYVIPPEGK